MTKDEFNKLKDIIILDLLQKEWSLTDYAIKDIIASESDEQVFWALFDVAQYIGERKAYGQEGVGDLHSELVASFWSKVGAPYPEF